MTRSMKRTQRMKHCLADVVANYDVVRQRGRGGRDMEIMPTTSSDNENEDETIINDGDNGNDSLADEPEPEPETEPAQNVSYRIPGTNFCHRKRRQAKIIRYPRFKLIRDGDNFYREQLMLFFPWRSEEEDLLNVADIKGHYETHEPLIEANKSNLFLHEDILREMDEQLEEEVALDPSSPSIFVDLPEQPAIIDLVASPPHQRDGTTNLPAQFDVFYPRNENIRIGSPSSISSTSSNVIPEGMENSPNQYLDRFPAPPSLTDAEFGEKLARLNDDQRRLLLEVYHRSVRYPENPFHIFVSGGAGVGKTALIEMIYAVLNNFYNRSTANADPTTAKVVLCAPTGRAAFNIQGSTIHSTFHLPLSSSRDRPMPRLGSSLMNKLQTKFKDVKCIIVDEASMVGRRLFHAMNTRCNQIRNTGDSVLFGNMSVIMVGDLRQLCPVGDT